MKKIYMQPAMMLVKTEAEVMICASDPTKKGSTDQTSGNLSKRRGIFGSDEPANAGGIW